MLILIATKILRKILFILGMLVAASSPVWAQRTIYNTLPELAGSEFLPLSYAAPPALLPLYTTPDQIAAYVTKSSRTTNGVVYYDGTKLTTASGLTYSNGGIQGTVSTDHSSGSADARVNLYQSTLSPSVNTTNIWENFNSFVILNGPGHANGEINIVHPYFQNNVGGFAAQVETLETSALNSGTITNFNNSLHIFNNAATGTVTSSLYGAKYQLTNSNATAGAIATYAAIDMEAMAGGGSAPTFNYVLRNADGTAYLSTLGNVNIGTISPQDNRLFVLGPDTSGGTFPVVVKNSTPANILVLSDAGSMTVGLSGGSSTLTAVGDLNVSGGVYKAAGTPGVNCAAGVTAGTVVVVAGIVTHC